MFPLPTIQLQIFSKTRTQNNIISSLPPFPSSTINPTIIRCQPGHPCPPRHHPFVVTHLVTRRCPPWTPTIIAQVITHRHRCCSPPPPSSMSSKDKAAFPPPTPPPPLPLSQTDSVKEIMAKVVSAVSQ
jgi:hypothetical protein